MLDISPAATANTNVNVPTLSTWGLVILAVLLGAAAALRRSRRT